MKKGRPGLLVSALATAGTRAAIEEAFFRESTTIGLRRSRWDRTVLDREIVEVETELGPVAVKLAVAAGATAAGPDLQRHPRARGLSQGRGRLWLPLRRVYEIVAAAAAARRGT